MKFYSYLDSGVPEERQRLARNAQNLIRREHSWPSFRNHVNRLFGELEALLVPSR